MTRSYERYGCRNSFLWQNFMLPGYNFSVPPQSSQETLTMSLTASTAPLCWRAPSYSRCYFQSEIHELLASLKRQNDLIVIKEKDYMTNPKESGWRPRRVLSVHNIVRLSYALSPSIIFSSGNALFTLIYSRCARRSRCMCCRRWRTEAQSGTITARWRICLWGTM